MTAPAHTAGTGIVAPDASGIARVVAELAAGSIVALPTETVYGLAADATNGRAVARIFEAKGRPRFNPLICHVDGLAMARANALFDPLSAMLADAFWPGPLTLVLPLRPDSKVHELVTAGLDTVAVRAPRGVARAVIARLGRPVAAPSANRSGAISPTTAAAVRESLGDAVPLICDGGPTGVGVESTIVRVHDGRIVCLRPGGLPLEQIEKVAGRPVARAGGDGAVTAPGMLASHYAPDMAVRLNVAELQPGEALLAFGPDRAARWQQAVAVENLSPAGDLAEAAANLFAMMHALDATGAACMAVEPIPDHGLGEAINDRLRRAAAPRPAP